MARYTIRYRCTARHGRIVLIVDDGRGEAYLFGTLDGLRYFDGAGIAGRAPDRRCVKGRAR